MFTDRKRKPFVTFVSMILLLSILIPSFPFVAQTAQTNEEPVGATNDEIYEETDEDVEINSEVEYEDIVDLKSKYHNDPYVMVYTNEDGTDTAEFYDIPVKYVDKTGHIKNKSLKIKETDEFTGVKYATQDNNIITYFSEKVEDGIMIEYGDVSILSVPKIKGKKGAELSVDSETVSYQVDEYTTYEYQLTYMGYKENIIVSEYTGQTSYDFTLHTNGLDIKLIDGVYSFVDDNDNVRATIADLIIFTADNKNNGTCELEVKTVKQGEKYKLSIKIDKDYLRDPDTTYPIIIDPTLSITSSNTTYGTIEDTIVCSTTTYSATSGSLYIGKNSSGGILRALMRFPGVDLTGCTVESAYVQLSDLMCQRTLQTVECYQYAGTTWSESGGISWDAATQSSYSPLLSSKEIIYGNGDVSITGNLHRYAFDITTLATKWATGSASPTKGIIFKATDEYENSTHRNI